MTTNPSRKISFNDEILANVSLNKSDIKSDSKSEILEIKGFSGLTNTKKKNNIKC